MAKSLLTHVGRWLIIGTFLVVGAGCGPAGEEGEGEEGVRIEEGEGLEEEVEEEEGEEEGDD